MTKLKTLNDISRGDILGGYYDDNDWKQILREEAIKDIKTIRKFDVHTITVDKENKCFVERTNSFQKEEISKEELQQVQLIWGLVDAEDYIMWKFNLTEEHLK